MLARKGTYRVQKETLICSASAFPPGTKPNKQGESNQFIQVLGQWMDGAGRKSVTIKGPWEQNEALQPGIYLSFLLAENQESSTQLMKPTETVFS